MVSMVSYAVHTCCFPYTETRCATVFLLCGYLLLVNGVVFQILQFYNSGYWVFLLKFEVLLIKFQHVLVSNCRVKETEGVWSLCAR